MSTSVKQLDTKEEIPSISSRRLPRSVRQIMQNRMAIIGLIIVLAFIFMGIAAEWIAPYDYDDADFMMVREGPSADHWLGNDEIGRDMLSRLIYGARISLLLGVISVGIGIVVGVPLGVTAGYFGGMVDMVIMSFIDILLAFPSILLAILMVAFLGPSLENAMIAIGVLSIPIYTRIVRSSTFGLKEDLFILAARALGATDRTIIFKHIIPNVLTPITVQSTLQMAVAIQAAAALGFLGLGAPPDVPEWGNMLQKGRNYIFSAPHIVVYPGIAIMLVVFGFSLMGDGLRDALDPRFRR